jgi:hypothetical protein
MIAEGKSTEQYCRVIKGSETRKADHLIEIPHEFRVEAIAAIGKPRLRTKMM